jgi:hypothetical protein
MSANKKVESGIYEIRKLLDQDPPGLWIFDECIGTINEFRHYSFNDIDTDMTKSYSEKIRKRDDDFMDCLRYAINSGIGPGLPGEERPEKQYIYSRTGRIMGIRA